MTAPDHATGPLESEDTFLELLAQDIERHPEHLQPLDASLEARLLELVPPEAIDLGSELAAADEAPRPPKR